MPTFRTSSRKAAVLLSTLLLIAGCRRAVSAYPDSLAGVGVVLQTSGSDHAISQVISGGPAATAGLAVGDRILAINGEATDGKTLATVVESLRGQPGSQVVVRVHRDRGDLTVTLTRERLRKSGQEYRVE